MAFVASAKLGLVLVRMVELFNAGVAIGACLPLGTVLLLGNERAKFAAVGAQLAAAVFRPVVVIWAFLEVVLSLLIRALYRFEYRQIQERNKPSFPLDFWWRLRNSFARTA